MSDTWQKTVALLFFIALLAIIGELSFIAGEIDGLTQKSIRVHHGLSARSHHWNYRTMLATAYCDRGLTKSGIQAGPGIVAVDPRVVRMHSTLLYAGYRYRAEDTGGLILGNRLDFFISPCSKAVKFGVRKVVVDIL